MSLEKLAHELEETARQSARMAGAIAEAVSQLSAEPVDDVESDSDPLTRIIMALQAQDRLEQRCRNLAQAAREMAEMTEAATLELETVWTRLELDELRTVETENTRRSAQGDIELF